MLKLFYSLLLWVALVLSTTPATALEIISAGDSITQGLFRTAGGAVSGITSPVNGAANIGGYQPRLNARLDREIESSSVYNYGVAGANSRDGISQVGSALAARPADYILIMYGANDLYQGISDSANQVFVANMIGQSRQAGVVPIISEVTPNTSVSGFDSAIANLYNVRLRGVAEDYEVEIAPMYQQLRPGWLSAPYHSGDQLHLNGRGYRVMADQWFARLKKSVHSGQVQAAATVVSTLLLD